MKILVVFRLFSYITDMLCSNFILCYQETKIFITEGPMDVQKVLAYDNNNKSM